MSDEYREITMEVEIDVSSIIRDVQEAVAGTLGIAWDLTGGSITKSVKVEVGVEEVNEHGEFEDPLTEETYLLRCQEDLMAEFRDALKDALTDASS